MNKKTGVVMELEGNYAVVLTSSGEFKRVNCNGKLPEIGQELRLKTKRKNFFGYRPAWAAVAAVLLLALLSPLSMMAVNSGETAVAWVSVDINPALDLAVNSKERVIDALAINSDGLKLLEQVSIKGLDVDEAIEAITNQANKMGYLGKDKDNTVLISVTSNLEDYDGQKLEQKLVAAAKKTLAQEQLVAVVQTVKTLPEFRETARKKGITAGKYAVLIEAANNGIMIHEEEVKDTSISEAIKNKGGDPQKILQQAHEEKVEQLPEKVDKYLMIAANINRDSDSSGTSSPEEKNDKGSKQDEEKSLITPIRDGNSLEGTNGTTVEDSVYKDKQVNENDVVKDPVDTNDGETKDTADNGNENNVNQTSDSEVNDTEIKIDNIRDNENNIN